MKTSVTSLEPSKKPSLEMRSFSDAPIQRKEDDQLNRLPFAKQIADLISFDQPDARVIGLYGEWGEGKTSVLNLALDEYEANARQSGQKTIIVRFCPWEYSAQTNLVKALFLTIAQKVQTSNLLCRDTTNKIVEGLIVVSNLVSVCCSYRYPDVVPAVKTVEKGLKTLMNWLKKEPTLEDEKRKLNQALSSCGCRIIVVIDDVDRLLHPEIRELIRAVKANGDLPKLVWIILCDRTIVAKAIAKDVDASDVGPGFRFIDKIIPIGLDLPKVPQVDLFTKFRHLLFESTSSLFPSNAETILINDPMESVRCFCVNMRNVKRLVNSILTSLRMFRSYQGNDGYPSIHLGDFVNLEAWKVFEPKFFTAIYQNQQLLLTGNNKIKESQLEEITNECMSKDRRKEALEFIKRRFGFMIHWASVNNKVDLFLIRGGDEPQNRYRLANSQYFGLYFTFRLIPATISRFDESRFLGSSSDVAQMSKVLFDLDKSDKLPSLLFNYETPPSFKTAQQQLNYLETLWLVAEKINSNDEYWTTGPLDYSRQTQIMRCSLFFMQKTFMDSHIRLEVFKKLLAHNEIIISQPLYLVALDMAHYVNKTDNIPLLERKDAEIVKQICLQRLLSMHDRNMISTHPNSFELRKHWYQVAGGEAFFKATGSDFFRYPDAYANLVPFSTIHERKEGRFHPIFLDELEKGCDVPKLIRFLKSHPSERPEFREMVQCLEFANESKKTGKPYDDEAQIRMIRELRSRRGKAL